jgi:hypothetical protein
MKSLKGYGIDSDLQKHVLSEAEKWKVILKRLLNVTLCLPSRDFPGILELLGRYEETAREHLPKVQRSQLEDETMKGKSPLDEPK